MPGRLIREMEGGTGTYVPSETNTVLLTEALSVPVGPLLEEREQLLEQWHHRDVVGYMLPPRALRSLLQAELSLHL